MPRNRSRRRSRPAGATGGMEVFPLIRVRGSYHARGIIRARGRIENVPPVGVEIAADSAPRVRDVSDRHPPYRSHGDPEIPARAVVPGEELLFLGLHDR